MIFQVEVIPTVLMLDIKAVIVHIMSHYLVQTNHLPEMLYCIVVNLIVIIGATE